MIGKRYSEGGSPTTLTFKKPPENTVEKVRSIRRNVYRVPSEAELSTTSEAIDCLVKRQFSKKMQQYLLNYSFNVVTQPVLSGEV